MVHIRIQQRNGRKTLTTVQGLSAAFDLKKIVRACKKEFACNGTVVEHPEYGEVLQMQGDQRELIAQFLVKCDIFKKAQIKVHGFQIQKHAYDGLFLDKFKRKVNQGLRV